MSISTCNEESVKSYSKSFICQASYGVLVGQTRSFHIKRIFRRFQFDFEVVTYDQISSPTLFNV